MADYVREALGRYELGAIRVGDLYRGAAAPLAFDALRAALDECDTSLAIAEDEEGAGATAMRIAAKSVRKAILSALTDSPSTSDPDGR